jgi:hypothetical protein
LTLFAFLFVDFSEYSSLSLNFTANRRNVPRTTASKTRHFLTVFLRLDRITLQQILKTVHCYFNRSIKQFFFDGVFVVRLVRQLSACYEASFGAKCGRDAGKLVSGLVDRAFDDPRYTRYRHRPDCRLHRHVDDDNRLGAMTNASAATAYDTSSSSPSASSSRQRHIRRHRTGGTEKRQAPPPVDGASADALEAERFDAAVPEALSSLDIDQRLSPADLDLDYVPSELSEMENAVDDATSCGCVTVSASSMTIGFVSAATVLFEITAMCSLR